VYTGAPVIATGGGALRETVYVSEGGCCSLRSFMLALLAVLFLVLIGGATYLFTTNRTKTRASDEMRATADDVLHARVPDHNVTFDCFNDYWDWQNRWSASKKTYCCKKEKRGCEQHYDCTTSQEGWKSAQKEFCCHKWGTGCPKVQEQYSHSRTYDCAAGYSNAEEGWSAAKKEWCCRREGAGCTDKDVVPTVYDCEAGFSNWEKGWSAGKKQWCCDHKSRGCEEHIISYDCGAGYLNWKAGWSEDKKTWCCDHTGKGCVEPRTLEG